MKVTHAIPITIPDRKTFLAGVEAFEQHEERDAMYKVATFLVSHFWGKPAEMADALGVLLLTWNQAFYRFGDFEFKRLEQCIASNASRIEAFKGRDISSLSDSDEDEIKDLFTQFLHALQIDSGKARGRKSPVGVAKALHLLAPSFFPLWDKAIALGYRCYYSEDPADKYVEFCKLMKEMTPKIRNYVNQHARTLLKLIDEYNYSKYTKKWI